MNLDRLQRIALARLLSDIIEADFIVEQKEMVLFEELISREGLNIIDSMLVEAKKMDYGKAVSILKELDGSCRQDVVDILRRMSLSDGECAPSEAIQIFAIEQALTKGATIHSVPSKNVSIGSHTVLYIENEDSTFIDSIINENFRTISDAFSEAGFSFVHIPHIVSDFAGMNAEYLRKAVKYMIPSVSTEKISSICDDLCSLTTNRFCRDLLYRKTGLNLISSKPSFLIKIGESIIVDQFSSDEAERTNYSNFLLVELDGNLMDKVREIIERYRLTVNRNHIVKSNKPPRKFVYSGFHRALFDLIAYSREQKDYRLVFDISKPQAAVYFEPMSGGERLPLKLTPQEITLFLLITRKSLTGEGLDWREQIPAEEKQDILKEYNGIYSFIGKGNVTTEYKDRTHTNHIKNRIRVIQGIANVEMFIPEHVRSDGSSRYRIKADSRHVLIIE